MKKAFNIILVVLVLLTIFLLRDPSLKFISSCVLTFLLFARAFLFRNYEDKSESNIYLLAGVLFGVWTVLQFFLFK